MTIRLRNTVKLLILCALTFIIHSLPRYAYSQNSRTDFIRNFVVETNSQKSQKAAEIVFHESFDEARLPDNWTDTVFNPNKTWVFQQQPQSPFQDINPESRASALCPWVNDTIGQNEWLITPIISTIDYQSLYLDFYIGTSETWLAKASLKVHVGVFASGTEPVWKQIWDSKSLKDTAVWVWRHQELDLTNFAGDSVKIGFQYAGNNGDLVGLDDITLLGGEASLENDILSFSISGQSEKPVIDAENKTVNAKLLNGSPLDTLVLNMTLSPGAYSEPASGDTINMSNTDTYDILVTAADSTTSQLWKLNIEMSDIYTDSDIIGFKLAEQKSEPVIDNLNKTVSLEVACTADLNALTPDIEISPGATILPNTGTTIQVEDGIPFKYIVTAQNPEFQSTWQLYIAMRDYTAKITGFTIPQQSKTALIDTVNHTINAEVEYGTDISKIVPTIKLADCATSTPASGDTMVFSVGVPQQITVYPKNENEEPVVWTVSLSVAKNLLLIQGFDVDTIFPPANWTAKATSEKTWLVARQLTVPFRDINRRSLSSALCPWTSQEEQDEWLISPWVKTDTIVDMGFDDLTLEFYAGFNHQYIYSFADLKVFIRKSDTDWENIWSIPATVNNPNTWNWRLVNIDLDRFVGDSVQLAWQYVGINGDMAGIDDVKLFSDIVDNVQKIPEKHDFIAYPNPFSNHINIDVEKPAQLRIYNLDGRLVHFEELNSGNNLILLEKLKPGMYFIELRQENTSLTGRIVKH